jgi:hypothetical protein
MVNAIATANTYLAGFDFGFGAMFPSWLQYRTFREANREKWVSHFTLRMIIILMETIKDLYLTRLARAPAPSTVLRPEYLSQKLDHRFRPRTAARCAPSVMRAIT